MLDTLMARPRLIAAVVAAIALLAWQREAAVSKATEYYDLIGLALAGAWLGWAYYSEIHGVVEVVPL